jgi:hypothetical protein
MVIMKKTGDNKPYEEREHLETDGKFYTGKPSWKIIGRFLKF